MAKPIPLELPPRDPRAELQRRLADAPAEHAEALLAGYEALQGLHDCGLLEVLRGATESRDKLLEIGVATANSPESIRGIRNLMVLVNTLGAIDPDALKTFAKAVPPALRMVAERPEPPGLWRLVKDFLWNEDFRHGLAAVNTLLEAFGKSLSGKQDGAAREEP